jgi:hypothetical protein
VRLQPQRIAGLAGGLSISYSYAAKNGSPVM